MTLRFIKADPASYSRGKAPTLVFDGGRHVCSLYPQGMGLWTVVRANGGWILGRFTRAEARKVARELAINPDSRLPEEPPEK